MKHIARGLVLIAILATAGFAQDQKPVAPAAASILTAEAQVCTGIADKMPTGGATSFAADVGTLYCWSKILGAKGETSVKHVWIREGKEMLTVDLSVKSIAWRTNSQKRILPQWTGNWEVRVVDESGTTLTSVAFTIGQSSN